MFDEIARYWNRLSVLAEQMPLGLVAQAAEILYECQQRAGTIFVLGNGGSAATASHFVCDLSKGTRTCEQPTFRVVALTDNLPLMTAWANDTSYDRVFAEQLCALVRPGDVIVAISVSGNSANVVRAAQMAQSQDATVIALTGASGGSLLHCADLAIRVPEDSFELVEDAHLSITHSVCIALRQRLQGDVSGSDVVVEQVRPRIVATNG